MSSITFQDQHGEVKLRGPERAWAGFVCKQLFETAFHAPMFPARKELEERLLQSLAKEQKVFRAPAHLQDLLLGITVYPCAVLTLPDGEKVPAIELILNTAMALGSDVVKFLARLDGQCEIHMWAEGEDRAWLADLIVQGRADGVLRPNMGWESVASFLRARQYVPVVCSYSVTASFPNPGVLGLTTEEEEERFFKRAPGSQWELCMTGLRTVQGRLLQISPSTLARRFGAGMDAFEFLERLLK